MPDEHIKLGSQEHSLSFSRRFFEFKSKSNTTRKTRCVCETRLPPKRPFFEKCNLYI